MGDFIVFLIFAVLIWLIDKVDNKRKPVPKQSRRKSGRTLRHEAGQRQADVPLPPVPAPWPEQQRQQPEVQPEPQIVWDIPAPPERAEQQVYREPGAVLQNMQEAAAEAADEAARMAAYEAARAAEDAAIRAQEQAEYQRQAKLPGTQPERKPLSLTPETAMQAVALSVILAPPRARTPRRYGFGGMYKKKS